MHKELTGDDGHNKADELGDEQEEHEQNAADGDGRAGPGRLGHVLGHLAIDVESSYVELHSSGYD